MNNRITRRKVAKQFIIAFELLLEWIEQKEHSNEKPIGYDVKETSFESSLLTEPEVARILNISKANAYRLIQLGEIPSVSIGRSVRVREEDLNDFISEHTTKGFLFPTSYEKDFENLFKINLALHFDICHSLYT